ncbi:antitoxin MazE family protein (plasmid) [Skermanella rosea]|uniref:antitoxin MazE-like protein n=1 Tax=Skermanella rosea TaxID=1817965 RepID=UPI001E319420|nr:antitoxin MazE-like protein [Skermanella rosea]UEM07146.1 antitoxin MazE family protein [Skermanella rosea]
MGDASRRRIRPARNPLREQGLRPATQWVREVRSLAFEAEARRQPLLVSRNPHGDEDCRISGSGFDISLPINAHGTAWEGFRFPDDHADHPETV